MKKILAIISSVTLGLSASATVISCGLETNSNESIDLSTLNGDLKKFNQEPEKTEILKVFNELNDLTLELDVDVTISNLNQEEQTGTIESVSGSKKVHKNIGITWQVRQKLDDTEIHLGPIDEKPSETTIKQAVVDQNDGLDHHHIKVEEVNDVHAMVRADHDDWHGSVAVKWSIRKTIDLQPIDLEWFDEEPTPEEIKDAVIKANPGLTEDDLELGPIEGNQVVVKAKEENGWKGTVTVKWSIRQAIDETEIDFEWVDKEPTPEEIKKKVIDANHGLTEDDLELELIENNQVIITTKNGWNGTVIVKWSIRQTIDLQPIDLEWFDEEPTPEEIKDAVIKANPGLTEDDLELGPIENNQVVVKGKLNNGWNGTVVVKWSIRQMIDQTEIDLEWWDKQPSDNDIKEAVINANPELGLELDDLELEPIENNQVVVKGKLNNGWNGTVVVKWSIRQTISNETIRMNYSKTIPRKDKIIEFVIGANEGLKAEDLILGEPEDEQIIVTATNHWQGSVIVQWKNMEQPTIYVDKNGKHQSTLDHNLENINSKEIIQIGFYKMNTDIDKNGKLINGDIMAVKLPKTVEIVPKELPSEITFLGRMFQNAKNFNQDISSWDVSNVKAMNFMFAGASAFNSNISNWNVSNVNKMYGMFEGASAFNQNISSWNVSNVTDMQGMFAGASAFNGNLSSWNVSNVTDMTDMFYQATSFNQNISNWNVSNVTNMKGMFFGATSFNQNISNWNVSNVTDMSLMFEEASLFNQDISSWDVSNVTNMNNMFWNAHSFNQNLSGWKTKPNIRVVINFSNNEKWLMEHQPDFYSRG